MGLFNSISMGKRTEKVILLTADSISRNSSGIPNCLIQTKSGKSIIESQIQILGLYNFARKNIIVVHGEKGPWDQANIKSYLKEDGIKLISNYENDSNTSADSLILALNSIKSTYNGDVLIIYSDIVFNTKQLDQLINYNTNCALIRKINSLNDHGIKIDNTNQVKYPWHVFNGMMKVNFKDIIPLKQRKTTFNNAFEAVKDCTNLEYIDFFESDNGLNATNSKTFDLNGGSFARLIKKLVVRKEVNGPGAEKLINEILWLQKFGDKFPQIFPKVVSHHIDENNVWYEMPFFDLPNIRKAILTFQIDEAYVMNITNSILDFNFKNLYSNVKGKPQKDWVKKAHFDRVFYRLFDVYNYSKEYQKLICQDTIILNGKTYKNLPLCFSEILKISEIENIMMPNELVDIHGDLHFQNILFVEETNHFILADPRGEINGSDVFYDLGKLLHSVNGKYDLIHTNQFDLSTEEYNDKIVCNLNFINSKIEDFYNNLKKGIFNLLVEKKEISQSLYWKEKVLFNECMHFCSVMTFHLNRYGDENRSMAMYLTGVKLINEFLELDSIKRLERVEKPKYYFNSPEDFISQLEKNQKN